MSHYNVVGVMSGTSLDGVDIAACSFVNDQEKWTYKLIKASTYNYPQEWIVKLKNAHQLTGYEFIKLHHEYGSFLGMLINDFIKRQKESVDFIASHGHTVFHKPKEGITCQIGDGIKIASKTRITTISDFRSMDIALGGQGAPLVPIGDKYLFSEYDFCLNLGGFANVSFDLDDKRVAFDICPVNFILNYFSNQLGQDYDKNGKQGKRGKVNQNLLKQLNELNYYGLPAPKSLSREWVEEKMLPVLMSINIPVHDKLRTLYEHIAIQIYNVAQQYPGNNIFLTGGGTRNSFIIELLKKYISLDLIIPDTSIIDYKEAIIFAFLGVLRIRNEINCLESVTGAIRDNMGGTVHYI